MEVALVIIGIVLLAAAAVGGKLALGGAEIPQITSVLACGALAVLGIVALLLGVFPSAVRKSTPTDDNASAPSPATPAGEPAVSSSADLPRQPEQPLWRGTLLLESAIDFGADPPTVTSGSDPTQDFYVGNDLPGAPINQLITLGTSHWTRECVEQLDWHWRVQLRPRLDGLTDAEYRWEPVPGCWSIRPRGASFTPASGAR